jgi:hypothetical protein
VNSLIEESLAMGGWFTAFLVSHWAIKAFEPKKATSPATIEYPRHKKVS